MAAISLLGGRHGAMGGEARRRKQKPFRPSMTSRKNKRQGSLQAKRRKRR